MAEGKTDPAYDPYIEDYLKQYNHPDILLVIVRSKNKNIVVYEANIENGTLDSKKPIDSYWLDIDPAYMEKARKKGKEDDRVDLGVLESKLAYGVKAKPTDTEGEYSVTLTALSKRPLTLRKVGDKYRLCGEINGKEAYVERVYVETKERMLGTPKVLFINLYGVDPASGTAVMEKITP